MNEANLDWNVRDREVVQVCECTFKIRLKSNSRSYIYKQHASFSRYSIPYSSKIKCALH